jgi:hypothetical protein
MPSNGLNRLAMGMKNQPTAHPAVIDGAWASTRFTFVIR